MEKYVGSGESSIGEMSEETDPALLEDTLHNEDCVGIQSPNSIF